MCFSLSARIFFLASEVPCLGTNTFGLSTFCAGEVLLLDDAFAVEFVDPVVFINQCFQIRFFLAQIRIDS